MGDQRSARSAWDRREVSRAHLLDRYKAYILVAVVLFLAQATLIGAMLVQAARRRKAEMTRLRVRHGCAKATIEIRDLNGRLLSAQENERSRIARELHDDVSQQLGLLAIDLQLMIAAGAERRLNIGGMAHAALVRTQSLVKSVHALSHDLHPEKLHLLGLVGAISSLQRGFSEAGMAVTFKHDSVPEVYRPSWLSVYRVAQEAIRNAMNHSASHCVSVHLSCNQDELILTIADDGVGFDVNAVAGKGSAWSASGKGWRCWAAASLFDLGRPAARGWRSACLFVQCQSSSG